MVDKKQFQKLYLEHYPSVKTLFLCKGFSKEDAEELTQDVFLRVYRYRADYLGKGNFRGWLNTICANVWKNRIRELRSLKRDAVVVSLDTPGLESAPSNSQSPKSEPLDQAIHGEYQELLWKAISQLPKTLYACVVLRVHHELNYQQIGSILKLNRETVKSRLYQAQGKLRTILHEDMHVKFTEEE